MKSIVLGALLLVAGCMPGHYYEAGHWHHRMVIVDSSEDEHVKYIYLRCDKYDGLDIQCKRRDTFRIYKTPL